MDKEREEERLEVNECDEKQGKRDLPSASDASQEEEESSGKPQLNQIAIVVVTLFLFLVIPHCFQFSGSDETLYYGLLLVVGVVCMVIVHYYNFNFSLVVFGCFLATLLLFATAKLLGY